MLISDINMPQRGIPSCTLCASLGNIFRVKGLMLSCAVVASSRKDACVQFSVCMRLIRFYDLRTKRADSGYPKGGPHQCSILPWRVFDYACVMLYPLDCSLGFSKERGRGSWEPLPPAETTPGMQTL